MKEQLIKWMPFLALASFAEAVFMIADGYYWNGIAFIGAGVSLSSAAAVYKKTMPLTRIRKELRNDHA